MHRIRVWVSIVQFEAGAQPTIDRQYQSARFVNHLCVEFRSMGYHVEID